MPTYILISLTIFAIIGLIVTLKKLTQAIIYSPKPRYAYPLIIPLSGGANELAGDLEYIIRCKKSAIERGFYTKLIIVLPPNEYDVLCDLRDGLTSEFPFTYFCRLSDLAQVVYHAELEEEEI